MRGFFFILFACVAAAFAQGLSLAEAVQASLAHSPKVRAAQSSLEGAQGRRTAARAQFFPKLSLEGKVTRINDDLAMNISVPPITVSPLIPPIDLTLPPIKIQDKLFFNASATAQWTVFAGGRLWAAYKAADGETDAQTQNLELVKNNVAAEAATRYLTLALMQQLDSLQNACRLSLQKHEADAQKLQDAGQIALAERLRASVALAEAERNAEDAHQNLSLARLALAESMGRDTNFNVIFKLSDIPVLSETLEAYKAKAVQNHPGLRQLALEEERAGRGLSAARGEWLPALAVFGKRELYTKDLTILEPEWAIGAVAQWELNLGGATVGKSTSARALKDAVALQKAQTSEDLQLLVEKLWRQYAHARSALVSLAQTETLAQESLRAQTKAFENGFATSLDVQDAQLALMRLQMAKSKSSYDAWISFVQLMAATNLVQTL